MAKQKPPTKRKLLREIRMLLRRNDERLERVESLFRELLAALPPQQEEGTNG